MDAGRVLEEAASLGLPALESGPEGFLPKDPAEASRVLEGYGLGLVGGFVPVVLHRRALDETLTFHDGDVVLVPQGYHADSAPPGYDLYYRNVMAGPVREWKIKNDPDHEWLLG